MKVMLPGTLLLYLVGYGWLAGHYALVDASAAVGMVCVASL
jgi:hypothetical protein